MNEGKLIRWCDSGDPDAMATAVANAVGHAIQSAIAARGKAVIALGGGTTPLPAYERLATQDLPWDCVVVIPTDDRMVPLGDPLSNVTALARIFEPHGARVDPLTEAVEDHEAAGQAADERLRSMPWPIDFVLLGVGGDGHTASLFPGEHHAAAIDPGGCVRALGVMPDPLPPEAPVARVSLSLAAIVTARAVAVAATGSHKRAVIKAAIEAGGDSPYPVGRVLAAIHTPVHIYWAPQ